MSELYTDEEVARGLPEYVKGLKETYYAGESAQEAIATQLGSKIARVSYKTGMMWLESGQQIALPKTGAALEIQRVSALESATALWGTHEEYREQMLEYTEIFGETASATEIQAFKTMPEQVKDLNRALKTLGLPFVKSPEDLEYFVTYLMRISRK